MANRYRVTGGSPLVQNEIGDVFDGDYSYADEERLVAAGALEIVPVAYEIVGGSRVLGHEPGSTFEHAFGSAQRDLLMAGGHIVPADTGRKRQPKKQQQQEEEE